MSITQPRLKSILTSLISKNNDTYISPKALAAKLGVTTRTLRSDIKNLNNSLKIYDVSIKNKRGHGLYLLINDREKFKSLVERIKESGIVTDGGDDYKKRLKDFLLLILTKPREIDDIISTMYISDSTVDKYLKEARKVAKNYHLKIQKDGDLLRMKGSESDIRSCIIDYIDNKRGNNYVRGFSKSEKVIFSDLDLNKLLTKVTNLIVALGLPMSDYSDKNITIHLALELARSKTNNQLRNFNRNIPYIREEYFDKVSKFFEEVFRSYELEYSEAEFHYFIYHLALNYPQLMLEHSNNDVKNKKIHEIVTEFLDRIKDDYVFNLMQDKELIRNLEKHLELLLKVKNINGQRKNPLLNVIVSTFPLAYEMTVTASPLIEHQLNMKLSPDELAFITLHVGASMERLYNNRWDKKRAALVCGSGTATAMLLKARLSSQFSEYLNIVGVYSLYEYQHSDLKNTDFVISTVPIYESKLPVIQVDLSNFQNDSNELYQYLVSVSDKNKVIMNLFDGKLIYLLKDKLTKEKVLDLMIDDLEKYHYVESDFRDNVYKREDLYSTAIGGGIAIPHPIKYAATQSKVSFARLNEPIKWDDKNMIKYVFLISVNKKDYPNIQELFTFLVDLQQNQQFRNLIDKCKTINETKDVLRTIIQSVGYEK